MSQLNDFVATHLGAIGLVIVIGCVVLVLMILMLYIQSRRIALLSERLDYLTQGADGESLEGVLASHLDTVVRVGREVDEMAARTAMLEAGARMHFGRLGLVRFNPFEDTGGNQSFALAMLDANNDGFVLSSLHSRTGTRVYSKAIFGAECETLLGAEEAQAVEIAASQGGGSPAPRTARTAGAGGKPKAAGRAKAAASAGETTKASRSTRAGAGASASNGGPAAAVAVDSEPAEAEAGPDEADPSAADPAEADPAEADPAEADPATPPA